MDTLKHDHQELLQLHSALETAAKARDAIACRRLLRDFRACLNDHLIAENTRLYLYVKATIEASEPGSAAVARNFQLEMNNIVKAVMTFVAKYSGDDALIDVLALQVELKGIGEALVERIQREERTLYPLYVPRGVPREVRSAN